MEQSALHDLGEHGEESEHRLQRRITARLMTHGEREVRGVPGVTVVGHVHSHDLPAAQEANLRKETL